MTRLLCGAALACALPSTLPAQGLFDPDVVEIEVLTGWREDGMGHIAALRIELAPGWKTYWRAPGDAGIPPMFDWSGSSNLVGVAPHWPVPDIFDQNGMRSIGYAQELVIPLTLARRDADAPIHLKGSVHIGICEEVCVPAELHFDTMLPPQGSPDVAISAAMADRPMTEDEADVRAATCAVAPTDDGLSLTMTVDMPALTGVEQAAIETADHTVWVAEPTLSRSGRTLVAETELVRWDAEPFAIDRSGIRMTVFGDGQAVDIRGCEAG